MFQNGTCALFLLGDQMELLIYGFATLRIASLIAQERGPWDMFGKLRDLVGVRYDGVGLPHATNELARGITCVWCNSLWIAPGWLLIKLLLPNIALYLAFSFAVSGAALLIYEVLEWLERTRQPS
jgi:hypothetical protein